MKNQKSRVNKKEQESVERLLDAEKLQKLESFINPEKVKYEFLQDSEDDEVVGEIDFDALVSLPKQNLGQINADKFTEENDGILFYCKVCHAEVEVSRLPSKNKNSVKFQCNTCQGRDILYGTSRGVKEYYERREKR